MASALELEMMHSPSVPSIAQNRARRTRRPVRRLLIDEASYYKKRYDLIDQNTIAEFDAKLFELLGSEDSDVDSIVSSVGDIENKVTEDDIGGFVVGGLDDLGLDHDYIPEESGASEDIMSVEEKDDDAMNDDEDDLNSDDEEVISGVIRKPWVEPPSPHEDDGGLSGLDSSVDAAVFSDTSADGSGISDDGDNTESSYDIEDDMFDDSSDISNDDHLPLVRDGLVVGEPVSTASLLPGSQVSVLPALLESPEPVHETTSQTVAPTEQ